MPNPITLDRWLDDYIELHEHHSAINALASGLEVVRASKLDPCAKAGSWAYHGTVAGRAVIAFVPGTYADAVREAAEREQRIRSEATRGSDPDEDLDSGETSAAVRLERVQRARELAAAVVVVGSIAARRLDSGRVALAGVGVELDADALIIAVHGCLEVAAVVLRGSRPLASLHSSEPRYSCTLAPIGSHHAPPLDSFAAPVSGGQP